MKQLLFAAMLVAGTFAANAQAPNTKIQVGQKAPELAFKNPADETVSLSKIAKGSYVLLDFWASWCRPCRMTSPKLVKLYAEYKDQEFKGAKNGFTIVSVSLDQNKEAWLKAIADDQLSWPNHMSDLGSWNSKAAEIYGVQFIPQAFLIGPDGKILAKYQDAEQATQDLMQYVKKKG